MSKILNSMTLRVLAFILIIVFAGVFAASFTGVVALTANRAYELDYGGMSGEIYQSWCYGQSENTLAKFAIEKSTENIEIDSAFAYTIVDKDDNAVEDTLGNREYQYASFPQTIDFLEEHDYNISTESAEPDAGKVSVKEKEKREDEAKKENEEQRFAVYERENAPYIIYGYVLADIPADSELYIPSLALEKLYQSRYELLALTVAAGVVTIALFVFLMAAAGRRAPDGAVTASWVERIPFDIYTAGMLVLGVGCTGLAVTLIEQWRMDMALGALLGVSVLGLVAVAVLWCMSFAVRLKLKNAIKSCVCYIILAWCWKIVKCVLSWCKKALRALAGAGKAISFVPRVVLIVLAVLLVEFVFMVNTDSGDHIIAWFFERVVLIALVIYLVAEMKRLLTAGREIANGNVAHRVDTARMRGALREHGEDLNRITDGMNKAIAERVKSERLKTELITNVSHDIKTPLTSIVSYVDLMEKEEIDNEKVREYLSVLSRQSARLKKLIEDLLEASKASTGNLAVNPERCDLGVMLTQTAGEYEDKLNAAGLELVMNKPEENVYIMADRQQLWRVFDNLMNNICKYSLPGTRVYLELKRVTRTSGETLTPGAAVTFRNISKTRLTVAEDELTERFVRGDSSRNTEGSGLGLSIANSLTELQHGKMKLVVDGDLFKVQLTFDTVK